MLNKSYKGLILCLTGLSDKYKCQQATRINNKHLQTNRSKYNLCLGQNRDNSLYTRPKMNKFVALNIEWCTLTCLIGSIYTTSCRLSGCRYFTLYLLSCTEVLGVQFMFKFKSISGIDSAYVDLGNGCIIVTWEMRCTSRSKSNL